MQFVASLDINGRRDTQQSTMQSIIGTVRVAIWALCLIGMCGLAVVVFVRVAVLEMSPLPPFKLKWGNSTYRYKGEWV